MAESFLLPLELHLRGVFLPIYGIVRVNMVNWGRKGIYG